MVERGFAPALRCSIASLVMGAVVYDVARLGRWNDSTQLTRNLLVYGGTVVFGAAVYAAVCALLRAPELSALQQVLRRRRQR